MILKNSELLFLNLFPEPETKFTWELSNAGDKPYNYLMALAELGIGASPQRKIPQSEAGNLETIFKDLSDRFGEGFIAPAIVEYVKGDDDKGKKESKVLAKMPRGLAPNEVLVVTFTPNTIAGTTNAFIYAVPEELDTKEVELMGAMHLEKY